jgi:hypothetical protein
MIDIFGVEDKQLYLFVITYINRTNSRRRTVAGVKDDNRKCNEEEEFVLFSHRQRSAKKQFLSGLFFLS